MLKMAGFMLCVLPQSVKSMTLITWNKTGTIQVPNNYFIINNKFWKVNREKYSFTIEMRERKEGRKKGREGGRCRTLMKLKVFTKGH